MNNIMSPPIVPAMATSSYSLVEDLSIYNSKDCGCIEATGVIGMFEVVCHLEGDGRGESIIDCGDWQDEIVFQCQSIHELLSKTEKHIESLPWDN